MGKLKSRLTARSEKIEKINGYWYSEYLCECGAIKKILQANVTSGKVKSCGCLNKEVSGVRCRDLMSTHKRSNSPIYWSWQQMKRRCLNKNCHAYPAYGGRGIKVCDRWMNSFENFLEDMGERPKDKSLDRIDNDGNYEPGNCRWATKSQQNRNMRKCMKIEFKGQTKDAYEWGELYGLDGETILKRIKAGGWSIEKALTTPHRRKLTCR